MRCDETALTQTLKGCHLEIVALVAVAGLAYGERDAIAVALVAYHAALRQRVQHALFIPR